MMDPATDPDSKSASTLRMYAGLAVGSIAAIMAIREAASSSVNALAVVALAAGALVGFFVFAKVRGERARMQRDTQD